MAQITSALTKDLSKIWSDAAKESRNLEPTQKAFFVCVWCKQRQDKGHHCRYCGGPREA